VERFNQLFDFQMSDHGAFSEKALMCNKIKSVVVIFVSPIISTTDTGKSGTYGLEEWL